MFNSRPMPPPGQAVPTVPADQRDARKMSDQEIQHTKEYAEMNVSGDGIHYAVEYFKQEIARLKIIVGQQQTTLAQQQNRIAELEAKPAAQQSETQQPPSDPGFVP